MYFVHTSDGKNADSGMSDTNRGDGWLPCAYEPPTHGEDEFCVCMGFVLNGDSFVAQFELRKYPDVRDEVTVEDKDAALRRFGVEV